MTGKKPGGRDKPDRGENAGRGRPEWKRWHVITIGSLAAFTAGIVALGTSADPPTEGSGDVPRLAVAEAQPCAKGTVAERDGQLSRDAVLRKSPSSTAAPIVNPSEVRPLEELESLATVGEDADIRIMCQDGDWARVRVLITSLRWKEGWVEASALRPLKLDDDGHRILTVRDIEWQPGSERDKSAITTVANLILRNDKRCEAIDENSLLVEGSPGNRQYTLICDGPAGQFAINFRPGDAGTRSFAMAPVDPSTPAPQAIGKVDAGSACMDAIQADLRNPGSVDFHSFADTTFSTDGARARFTAGFTAQNGFGNEVENTAACVFEGDTLVSAEILPAGS